MRPSPISRAAAFLDRSISASSANSDASSDSHASSIPQLYLEGISYSHNSGRIAKKSTPTSGMSLKMKQARIQQLENEAKELASKRDDLLAKCDEARARLERLAAYVQRTMGNQQDVKPQVSAPQM